MTLNLCPICETGELDTQTERIQVTHLHQKGSIYSQYSICNCCGSEQATTIDARNNKRAMNSFKKEAQFLLKGREIRVQREQWRLTQADCAKVFGGGKVAFSKYESDDVIQSEAMDKLFRLAMEVPAAFKALLNKANIKTQLEPVYKTTATVKKPEIEHDCTLIRSKKFEQKTELYA